MIELRGCAGDRASSTCLREVSEGLDGTRCVRVFNAKTMCWKVIASANTADCSLRVKEAIITPFNSPREEVRGAALSVVAMDNEREGTRFSASMDRLYTAFPLRDFKLHGH